MITLHFTEPAEDGSTPAPGPDVYVEEWDIEDEGDLSFTHDEPLVEWLKTSDHSGAVKFREIYEDPEKFKFLMAYNSWWGQIEFVEDEWSRHTITTLL